MSNLNNQCFEMATKGGYILAFARRIAAEMPALSWEQLSYALQNNGHGFCGYHPSVVRKAFGR